MEEIEMFPAPTTEEAKSFQLRFGEPAADLGQNKANFKRWILLKGLGDIHQCIGTTLQRFIIFKTVEAEMKANSTPKVETRESELRLKLSRCHYPQLIEKANLLCSEPLILQEEMESFNLARNCLEHGVGMVVERFCNSPQKDKLIISGRRFKLYFKRGDEEARAEIGEPGPENAALMMGADDFEIQFAIGRSLELSLKDFLDILNTCVFFRADIEEKLAP